MKVAIIGAGISGLSCAIELERHNINPVIYEKNDKVGDLLGFCAIWPRMLQRTYINPMAYLRRTYGLSIKPISPIREIVMYSPNKRAVQHGSLGYIFKRGFENYSLENQLASKLDTQILFNRYIDIDEIKDEYDYIIVATGFNIIAKKMGVWTDTLNAISRVANAVGRFRRDCVTMWLDKDYCKNGFCYSVPVNDKQATIAMVVNGITGREADYYWKQFLTNENLSCTFTETTDAEHVCGFAKPLQKENVLFVGNAGGFTDDLIGSGGLNAIESGMLAAKAIIYGEDYNSLVKSIYEEIEKYHEMRKALNTLTNRDYDRLITAVGIPVLKNAVYNNPFFRLSSISHYAKVYNTFVRRKSILK